MNQNEKILEETTYLFSCRHDDPTIKASMEAGFELKIGPKLDLSLAALGDTLKVTVANVNLDRKTIDFEIVDKVR